MKIAEAYQMLIEDTAAIGNTFSEIWIRILAHLAAEDVATSKLRNKWKCLQYGEQQMEEWETYCTEQITGEACCLF